ncbi:hypothetical protein SK128_000628 [Halocaridina rubra]|uniref:Uncharacterized protein n=1 Tax=Halocaridina rubra TaxID=373956 RepID=A0AAN8X466_HALRR
MIHGKGVDILLLHRLAEVMLRAVRSGRPLIHIMRAWAVVGPHFMEAACHKDGTVSKKAVSAIHDIVNALLNNNTELPHFHFNEALFKPFENLLCLELCDADIQDQVALHMFSYLDALYYTYGLVKTLLISSKIFGTFLPVLNIFHFYECFALIRNSHTEQGQALFDAALLGVNSIVIALLSLS